MSNYSLLINFSNAADVVNPYWLRMELEEETTTMTVGEAADLIDALYKTSPCDEEETPEEIVEPTTPDWEDILALINLPVCQNQESQEDGDSGAYDVTVRVYRSHQSELYKLVMSNGSAKAPHRTYERVIQTLEIDVQSSITLDTPITGRPVICWVDIDGPDISILGNTLYWNGTVTGTIRAEFDTIYDVIDIHVTGIEDTVQQIISGTEDSKWLGTGWYSGSETGEELTDVQDTECNVLAFYHYQYQEITLHKPEIDESVDSDQADAICQNIGSTIIDPGDGDGDGGDGDGDGGDDDKKCFKELTFTTVCICGGEEGTDTEKEPAACGAASSGSTVAKEDAPARYTDCGHDSEVHLPEFYEDNCCEPPPFPLPNCEDRYAPFTGDLTPERLQELKESYGPNANIIMVGPSEGRCGDFITSQKIDALNCCDEVVPMEPHPNNPTEVHAGQTFEMRVLYGADVKEWTSSNGYVFSNGRQHIIAGNFVDVTVMPNACEGGEIRVNDGCTELQMAITLADVVQLGLEIADPEEPVGGTVEINVVGTITPITLTTEGATYFQANGEQVIAVSAGLVMVVIPDEQVCTGEFNVEGVNECGETDSVTVNPEDYELPVCFPYESDLASMAGWCADGPIPTIPVRWFKDGGFEYQGNVNALDCGQPQGTFYLMYGITPAKITITQGVPDPQDRPTVDIKFYFYIDGVNVSEPPCEDCPNN